jgi:hypothetical protein
MVGRAGRKGPQWVEMAAGRLLLPAVPQFERGRAVLDPNTHPPTRSFHPPPPPPQAAKLSSFQLEVSAALGQLGIEHELEYLTAVNLLSVDIAIVKGGTSRGGGGGLAAADCLLLKHTATCPCVGLPAHATLQHL